MAKKNTAISIRFPKELGDCVERFCRETVRNKTDIVNAAVWLLFSRKTEEVEKILKAYAALDGKLLVDAPEAKVSEMFDRIDAELRKNRRAKGGRSAG
jgi:hypothetical protein